MRRTLASSERNRLEQRLAPRRLSDAQRQRFLAALASAAKGPVTIAHGGLGPEIMDFTEQIRSLLLQAGFTVNDLEYPLSYSIATSEPWFLAVVARPEAVTPYTENLIAALRSIDIEPTLADGSKIASSGEVKLYVGAKQ